MTLYLPHTYDILKPVEPLARLLTPRPLAHWRRDAATWKDSGRRDLPLPRPLEGLIARMSSHAARMLLLFSQSPSAVQKFDSYVTSTIAPVGWWSMKATSGTNEANRGSGGAALDMTITSATLGQTGKFGANEASLLDGANSRYQTANNAALAALATWEYVFLVNPTNAGEGGTGTFASWGNGGANNTDTIGQFNGSIANVYARVYNNAATGFLTNATYNFPTGAWSLLFVAYADGGDRKCHLYSGVSGVAAELTYSAQPALTGTHQAPTLPLNLGNFTSQAATFAGLFDEVLAISGNLVTATTRTQLTVLAGV